MECKFENKELGEACVLLNRIAGKLDGITEKLLDSAIDKSNKQTKVHFVTMLVTIGLLGGVQVFNSWVERTKIERLSRKVDAAVAELPAEGSLKP